MALAGVSSKGVGANDARACAPHIQSDVVEFFQREQACAGVESEGKGQREVAREGGIEEGEGSYQSGGDAAIHWYKKKCFYTKIR